MKPVIYFAFADHEQSALPNLRKEQDRIVNALREPMRKGKIEVVVRGSTHPQQIFDDLEIYKNRIAVIHFAGHANSNGLSFGAEFSNAIGLAKAFGMQKRLKLVFLNGCSTYEQEALLRDEKIPMTIATSTFIDDSSAAEFAERFYRALSTRESIRKAFRVASAWLEQKNTSNEQSLKVRSYRHLDGIEEVQQDGNNSIPWTLYCLKKRETNYRLWKKYTQIQISALFSLIVLFLGTLVYVISIPPKQITTHLYGFIDNWESIDEDLQKGIYLSLDLLPQKHQKPKNGSFRFDSIPAKAGTGARIFVHYHKDTLWNEWVELPGPEEISIPSTVFSKIDMQ